VLGIEPTEVSKIAAGRGIPTVMRYFSLATAAEVNREYGPARVVTAANCFAHIEVVHAIVEGIVEMLSPDGVFISESHYLIGLLDTLQYDTVYHEHLRYTRSSLASSKCSKCSTPDRSRAWRLDPGLRGAARRHAGERQRRADAGGRTSWRRDAGAAQGVPQRCAALEAARNGAGLLEGRQA
jgi:hypothetical protein